MIRLKGFDVEEGKIPFSLLCKLSDEIIKISEGALRLYLEGSSVLKRGKTPDWLKASIDFKWSGLSKGSTVLKMEAPLLGETLKSLQYVLFHDPETEDITHDTAFSLAMLAYDKAIKNDQGTTLLDKSLLKEMLNIKKLVSNESTRIEVSCPSVKRKISLNKQNFEKIKTLETSTPEPVKIKLSGKLDVMKHTHSQLEIISNEKKVKVILPESFRIDEMKQFFGREVTIQGLANFNPARQIVSIELADIKAATGKDVFFRQIPHLLKEKTDIKQLIAEKNYRGFDKVRFNKLIDELDIAEPLEDLINSLTK